MGRIKDRSLRAEDFEKKYKSLVDKFSFVLNGFMKDVTSTLNGSVDFDNLAQEKVVIRMTVDGSGFPIGNDIIQNTIGKISGISCIKASPLDVATNTPTGTPFVITSQSGGFLKASKITNLVANEEYQLTLILIK